MNTAKWNVAEAKASFSEVLNEAQSAPQIIENRGKPVAVVIGIEEYRAIKELREQAAPRQRLAAFLRFSGELRGQGGADLELPQRSSRPAPFSAMQDD